MIPVNDLKDGNLYCSTFNTTLELIGSETAYLKLLSKDKPFLLVKVELFADTTEAVRLNPSHKFTLLYENSLLLWYFVARTDNIHISWKEWQSCLT